MAKKRKMLKEIAQKTSSFTATASAEAAKPVSVELIAHFAPSSTCAETYRSIRTTLLLAGNDSKVKTFIVTSALPLEGKTTTVSNLAVTLAQLGKSTLIIDADLRNPGLHRVFKVRNLSGLSNFLRGGMSPKDLLQTTNVPGLFLINAGPVPPNPMELLGLQRMGSLIDELKGSFDYVLIDTPPILAVSDALVLRPWIDSVILVVWGGKTSGEALRRAREKLAMHKIKSSGVILNNIRLRDFDYYYVRQYYKHYGSTGA
jgi:capsular exopolysaccharide synthesis family protein